MQFIVNTQTGHMIVERYDVVLPDYEIGQTIIYKDKHGIEIEADIVGYYISNILINNECVSEVLYQLDNSDTVLEPDVEKYYDMED